VASGSIALHPAQPTLEEGVAYARYLNVAADGFFGLMLGRKMPEIIAEAFLEPGHDLSHQYVTFAERDGSIVGMASGFTAEQHRRATDEPLTRAAGKLRAVRMGVVAALGRRVLRFIDAVPDGDFYLEAVAVDNDQRGRGVGSTLIDHMEKSASAQGCQRIVLDVAAANDGARRLYESRGMSVEAESPRMMLAPGMTALRMVKAL
jgi:ribosomal protein S18 acetylase RimI-like enzyme